jgi:lipopolysaccharide transport system permease protein
MVYLLLTTSYKVNMEEHFKTHISSEHRMFDLHLRETFQYRDLIFLLVKKDFTALYKQTILGPLWAIIQPLLTTIVFTIVFGNLARLTTADIAGDYNIPGFLFYMCGNICWGYFSSTLHATSGTFLTNRVTMGKVYYPRLVAPIAAAFSQMIAFVIQFAMMFIFWMFSEMRSPMESSVMMGLPMPMTARRPFSAMVPSIAVYALMVLGTGLYLQG